MINRELIRIKVVQLTYAYYQNGSNNIDSAEKELVFSLSKAYDLYHTLLALIVAVTKEARRRVEATVHKSGSADDGSPDYKFAYNKFALQLEENHQLQDFIAARKHTWDDSVEFVRNLCTQIEQSQIYADYMAVGDDSYDSDRELWRKIYKNLITDNDDLQSLLEDWSLYWNDDKDIVDTFVLKTIKRFEPKNRASQPLLPEYRDEEDKDFACRLLRATILNGDQYQRYMSEASRNWDFSRLAYMDVVIMQIAIAEMMTFANIPLSVTINEYVDLAKVYSTPRSYSYVNGMLDAIARHLIRTGKLMKTIDGPRTSTSDSGKAPADGSQTPENGSAEQHDSTPAENNKNNNNQQEDNNQKA